MKRDLPGVVRRVATFLGRSVKEEQVAALAEHLSFSSMAANTAVNKAEVVAEWQRLHGGGTGGSFMRKGKVGDWREQLTPDQQTSMDQWAAQWLAGSDLQFTYTL